MKLLEFKKFIKIWFIGLKISFMNRMAYKYNFFIMAVGVLAHMILTIIFVKVLFNFINNLVGWTYEQALLVVATYMMIEGLMWATCACLGGLTRNVNMGTLDIIITKPIDSQFLVSVWRGDPEDWMRVITALFIFSQCYKGINIDSYLFLNIIYYLILLFNAYIIVYSINLLVKTLVFWVIDSSALWTITENITRVSQYSTDIFFHKTVRFLFSTIIPLAFIATVPAKFLVKGFNLPLFLSSCFLAIIFFVTSRKFWLFGLKHYSSASS